DEVISVTEAMRPNCRSSGVATEEAMISGLAPGREAETETVGKSTCGRGETGSNRKATTPDSATAAVSSVVAIGRLMKGEERLTFNLLRPARAAGRDLLVHALALFRHGGCGRRPNGKQVSQRIDKSPALCRASVID